MTYRLDDGREIPHGAKVKIIVEGGGQIRGRLINVLAGRAYVMTADGILVGSPGCLAECEPWGAPLPLIPDLCGACCEAASGAACGFACAASPDP